MKSLIEPFWWNTFEELVNCLIEVYFIDSPRAESGPRVLWSLYFNLSLCLVTGPVSSVLGGVYVTSDPDTSLNYEGAVKEVKLNIAG